MLENSVDDYPFRREWVIGGRDFGEGLHEINATRFDRYMRAQSLHRIPKAKRGESEKKEDNRLSSAKRARRQVRLRCKAMQADRMITLTYRENMEDKGRLKRDFDALRRRLGRFLDFKYIAVPERQKRGAWHIHIAVRGRQNYRILRAIWHSIVGADNGNVDVRNPFRQKGLRHKLAGYLSKYITKDFAEHEMNEKRYWTSKGITVPERQPIAHILSDDPVKAIVTAFEAAETAGASLDHCQVYWNQDLGCLWLATREN
ncbi:rolling circle replication-associated protein [Pandoraea sputorum]|uniref:Replication-associated protein ORF2/G2P domain-containing protein n=1 Tax=Pandoraea sputorum TaxID=93222 RepID=A0A239SNM4_9BURK|nr:hypothetical protein [Pandoraea sputorum]AJC17987.1 hypothetical protein NA29_22155 [Pandoraea sputorum]BET13676.1 bacteriophage-like protein [Pandoraea sputorum]SNU86996.1 Uncharacterised protein [Pandoraea sputorum]